MTAKPFSWWDGSQRMKQRTSKKQYPCAAGWAEKFSSVSTFAATLARLSFWSQLRVSHTADCGCAEGSEQWHSPGQQLPAPQSLQQSLPAPLPAWWELWGALLRALNHWQQLSFSRTEKLWKKALITGHKHLQYSCLGATELQPNGWNPKGSVQHSGQSRVS